VSLFTERFDSLERRIDQNLLEHNIDGEPAPPNPRIATPEEIEAYKKTVLEAGNKPPERG